MNGPLVRVICNPASGGGGYGTEGLLPEELDGLRPEVLLTDGPGDAREAAREWGSGLLVVAGGDGTVNEVIDGLGLAGFPEGVTLALLPVGTGNDLARTLDVPVDPALATQVIRRGRVKALDAVSIRSEEVGERFFANVATGGLGADISRAADDPERKSRWGRLTYLRAALGRARRREAHRIRLVLDGEERELRAVNVTVANCRYAGGGWPTAPEANPEDGLLDLVVMEDAGAAGMLSVVGRALAGANYPQNEGVFSARARRVRVETQSGFRFTTDGESVGEAPAEFTVLPRALKMIVGPGYIPEVGRPG
ncbi:MAG: diacylglycerol kinase family lipid kinase [Actinomycetota bacterium]|nr:diacylglycerol kinase family lipid kinase [Actinomycetota bacterium]